MAETPLPAVTGEFAAAYDADRIAAAARERGEPDWLVEARTEAARAFAATPMPTTRLRPWKYTDVSDLEIGAYAPVDLVPAVTGTIPGGFAGTLRDAVADADEAERVRASLGSVVPATEGKFIAANGALWTHGVYVRAPRGQVADAPVEVTVQADATGAVFPRVLVVAEPQAEITVVLRYASEEAADLLASTVVEVVAEQAAQVRLLIDAGWGYGTREFAALRARIERDAKVRVGSVVTGGRIVKQTLEGLLEGEGANASLRAVAVGDREQLFDFVTLQNHSGPHTVSDVHIRSALAGASKAIYYGITRVEETASGAEAEQENRNLLLTKHATANSDPVLEILTNEVIRCGHGATVGPVDQEALFYLQSRGLDRRQALTLLVTGFLVSALGDDTGSGLAEELTARIERKLATAEL